MKPSTQQAVLSINVGTVTTHMRDRNRPENTPIINMGTLKEKPSKLLQETHAGDQRSLNRAHGTRHLRQAQVWDCIHYTNSASIGTESHQQH